ncbi:MAG: HEAT repeat domain-containing protein, partial [Nannocystaceae bacterium]|nr:HEAT repeat domain-containing protein [Nannocystaceae bacterium]
MRLFAPLLVAPLLVALGVACGTHPDDPGSLARRLASSDRDEREAAAVALGQLGPRAEPAIAALQKTVLDPDLDVRVAAVKALARVGPPGRRGLAT